MANAMVIMTALTIKSWWRFQSSRIWFLPSGDAYILRNQHERM